MPSFTVCERGSYLRSSCFPTHGRRDQNFFRSLLNSLFLFIALRLPNSNKRLGLVHRTTPRSSKNLLTYCRYDTRAKLHGERPSGHAIVVFGFNRDINRDPNSINELGIVEPTKKHKVPRAFEVQNSWGSALSKLYIPYAFFKDPRWIDDVWVIKTEGISMTLMVYCIVRCSLR